MVNAAFVSDVQSRVPNTGCPLCGEPHLEFGMRCDMGNPECLFFARCGRCHTVFDLDADSFPSKSRTEDIRAAELRCARCEQNLAFVALACSATSHSCRYTLRCPHCDSD